VGLFKRKTPEQTETPCPRCKVLVPVGDNTCNVCGWDMLEQYREPAPSPEPRIAP